MRIAIVDDRALAVEAVRRVLAQNPGYQVAWVARDGEEAVRRAAADRPDLILMDLVMPVVNGAEATRRIMAASPCPILVVTATVSGNFGLVYEALGAGAVDAVNTPTLGTDGGLAGGDVLLAKIAQVARKVKGAAATRSPVTGSGVFRPPLLAVGASTGGPKAIVELLAELPPSFNLPVLVVNHLGADFTAGLADWITAKTKRPARLAAPGDLPVPGTVLVAGRNDHLVMLPDGTLGYTPHPADTPFRPNIDVLFASLAAFWPTPGPAALLTGMQQDGAKGLLKLRQAGWTTYAQQPSTCAVNSMPEAAIKLGAAQHVLSPAEIGWAVSGRK